EQGRSVPLLQRGRPEDTPSATLCAAKTGHRSGMRGFWREFQRRNVFRVGAAYVAVSWLLIQLINNLAEMLATPPWVGRAALILVVAGFPVALILAWFLEPDAASDVTPAPTALRRRLNFTIVTALACAVVFLLADKYLFQSTPPVVKAAAAGAAP